MKKMTIIYWSQTGNTAAMAQAIREGAKEAGAAVLEECDFEPFFAGIEGTLTGKKLLLFGSYSWGDGQWMRDWYERAQTAGADLCGGEGLIWNETPDAAGLEVCRAQGRDFAAY